MTHVRMTYKCVLLAARAIASVRLQEASIDELQVGFHRGDIACLALGSQSVHEDRRDKYTNEA